MPDINTLFWLVVYPENILMSYLSQWQVESVTSSHHSEVLALLYLGCLGPATSHTVTLVVTVTTIGGKLTLYSTIDSTL